MQYPTGGFTPGYCLLPLRGMLGLEMGGVSDARNIGIYIAGPLEKFVEGKPVRSAGMLRGHIALSSSNYQLGMVLYKYLDGAPPAGLRLV